MMYILSGLTPAGFLFIWILASLTVILWHNIIFEIIILSDTTVYKMSNSMVILWYMVILTLKINLIKTQ